MKLRNKKTGKITNLTKEIFTDEFMIDLFSKDLNYFESKIDKLLEEWEDYEDDDLSKIIEWIDKGLESEKLPVMVNDFVEKLKAWKRLKDKGFKFFNNKIIGEYGSVSYRLNYPLNTIEEKDLNLLFGGEHD